MPALHMTDDTIPYKYDNTKGKYLVTRRDGTTPMWPWFVMGARDRAAQWGLRAYAIAAWIAYRDWEYTKSVWQLASLFKDYLKDTGEGDPAAPKHLTDDPETVGRFNGEQTLFRIMHELHEGDWKLTVHGLDAYQWLINLSCQDKKHPQHLQTKTLDLYGGLSGMLRVKEYLKRDPSNIKYAQLIAPGISVAEVTHYD